MLMYHLKMIVRTILLHLQSATMKKLPGEINMTTARDFSEQVKPSKTQLILLILDSIYSVDNDVHILFTADDSQQHVPENQGM